VGRRDHLGRLAIWFWHAVIGKAAISVVAVVNRCLSLGVERGQIFGYRALLALRVGPI
jgi:hypothetical protein